MPVHRDKKAGCYCFTFDRYIDSQRVRARKLLPKAWSQAQADAYDRQESARLYAIASGITRQDFTIDDAVKAYISDRCKELKSGDNAARELMLMFWAYQARPMSALSDVCKAYAIKMRDSLAPATIKNRIRYLTAACRYGWKHHGMSEHDPAEAVIVPTVRNERQMYITREQMLRLARACDHRPTRAVIRIAFYSGMRLGEIMRAKRIAGCFVLDDTKNGNPRIVPIHPRINTCLKYKMPTRYIIGYHFRMARSKVGMEDLHIHDLRHSAASELINNGVDLYTVGAVLGHKSNASTKRYSHLATDSLRAAIGKIGKKAA